MELNRGAVERFINVSHFEGNFFLDSLSYSTQRGYAGTNPDGSVTGKKGLTIGQENIDKDENPYHRVIPTGDGWAVLINGQKILQDLQDREKEVGVIERKFIGAFNGTLHHALLECLTNEKLSSVKDKFFRTKLAGTLIQPGIATMVSALNHPTDLGAFLIDLAIRMVTVVPAAYAISEFFFNSRDPFRADTNPRQGVQIFLPPVRVEDVVVGKMYLETKGRTLVRSKK